VARKSKKKKRKENGMICEINANFFQPKPRNFFISSAGKGNRGQTEGKSLNIFKMFFKSFLLQSVALYVS